MTNDQTPLDVLPSLEQVEALLKDASNKPNPPNLVPLSVSLSSEFQTPTSLYLKLTAR
jgi:anthranilate synthase component 1